MNFTEYYGDPFRSDLNRVYAGVPPMHEHSGGQFMQPRTLSRANQVIRSMRAERLEQFAAALFFTVLIDQVVYTHFGSHYQQFRSVTQYPKFTGDCPGGCGGHRHPSMILDVMGLRPGAHRDQAHRQTYRTAVLEAMPVMRRETEEFFQQYIPGIAGADVWHKCVQEVEHTLSLPPTAPTNSSNLDL